MAKVKAQDNLIFGLDIGTRSIVGTVGYLKGEEFHVSAQCVKEHETRAMLDGQIHDIMKVGDTVKSVKEALEKELSVKLTDVCIAAAGRVLRTVTVNAEKVFDGDKEINNEDIYNLQMDGVEKAYAEFCNVNDTGLKFYCVGYTPVRYYMNGYSIGNLEGHKAGKIAIDLIATFLPDDVVDGLYKAVEYAGLKVANLTLEPIAAIQVAIPEKFRMLNLALVDVGAGTSDISITSGGSIVAYGMIPTAGDGLTDVIAQNCLVEFDTAERIKRASDGTETIEFEDIIGLPQTIEPAAVLEMLEPQLDSMTTAVAEEIKKLNGDKSVSAVFVVGGGGTVSGYTEKLAEKLGIAKERVAIRGKEVMQTIQFENDDPIKDSLMVTPIGICLSYYTQSNNFIFVEFNGTRLKLYDNGNLTVSDVAMQMSFSNDDLFPKRGKALTFTLDDKAKMIRGTQGDSCIITINDAPADLHTQIISGDRIVIVPSTKGEDAKATLGELKEMAEQLKLTVNGKNISLPKSATVNGEIKATFYEIEEGDVININNFYTVEALGEVLDCKLDGCSILVNGTPANINTRVYEGFTLDFTVNNSEAVTSEVTTANEMPTTYEELAAEDDYTDEDASVTVEESTGGDKSDAGVGTKTDAESNNSADPKVSNEPNASVEPAPNTEPKVRDLRIIANGNEIIMHGKKQYVFVDVFDYIEFDLRNPAGRHVVTLINGVDAEYMKPLVDGDVLEIYWR